MSISVGDRAEPFALPYEPGGTIDLADHLGRDRIVLPVLPFGLLLGLHDGALPVP